MITEDQAKQMVAEMSGLKRWRGKKAHFGDLVCEDEGDFWYFQIPTNISGYDPEGECLSKIPATGDIDKETGSIELRIFIWDNPWRVGNRNHGWDEEDIPRRYRKYPLYFHEDPSVYRFNNLEKVKKYLRWSK